MSIQLQQFLNVAKNTNVALDQNKQGEVALKTGRFQGRTLSPFNADKAIQKERNLQTTGLFLNALAKEYGNDITSSLASKLDLNSGAKPLSGKVIHRVVEHATALRAFNAQVVKDFMQMPKGALKTLAEHDHINWLNLDDRVENKGYAAGKQFVSLLQEACRDCDHPLTQKEVAQKAEEVILDIHQLSKSIKQGLHHIADSFKQQDHHQILSLLDNCAEKVQVLGQFDLAEVDKEKLGADDKSNYQQRIASEFTQSLTPKEADALLTSMLSNPVSKELFQLLGTTGFKMELMDALGEADLTDDELMSVLTKLCRTETLLDALLTELDKHAHGASKASARLNNWLSHYAQGQDAGQISGSHPQFAKAYTGMQAATGVDLALCGLDNIRPQAIAKEYFELELSKGLETDLNEIADKSQSETSQQFIKDFDRATYFVNDVQISRNEHSEHDDIEQMPAMASYLANQELFGAAFKALLTEQGVTPIGDSNSTFYLYTSNDGSMKLHAQLEMDLKMMIGQESDNLLDPGMSPFHLDVNLSLIPDNGKLIVKLDSPIALDYRAMPAANV